MEVDNYQGNKLQILGKLTASLVHEIRNPLSAMKLSLQYLQMIREDLPEDVVESIKACTDATERIHSLVENLSSFTRKNYNGRCTCSITTVTNDAISIINPSVQEKSIVLTKELDESLPEINFDRNKLLQVFLNLMTNAVDACENAGNIRIKTYRETGSNAYIWQIEDDGVGISDEDKNKILNDFYTSKSKGTGLGLSVCQSILNDHHCEMRFESELGIGSRFIIFINPNPCQD